MFFAQESASPTFQADPASSWEMDLPVICFPFSGGIAGGSHVSACKLIQSLDRRAFRPLVLLHHDGGEVAELLRAEDIPYEMAPSPHLFGRPPGLMLGGGASGLFKSIGAQRTLARYLRSRRIGIVHTNEGPMHSTWALPAFLSGVKLLWHHRSSPEAKGLRYLAPQFADHVVSVSSFALSEADGLRARGKTSVVYSPFDTQEVSVDRKAARRELIVELGVPAETRTIGYFGNLVDRKRPLLFVDVIAEISRMAPDVPVMGLIFGATIDEGLDLKVKARAEERGVADRLRLMGFRYPAVNWLAASDIHAVTAVGEPFGRSLIEAMLLGTPVVAAASGGNIEAIRHEETGCLAAADDASALAEAIVDLLRHPDKMARIAEAARADALQRFGRERHAEEISAIYRKLLAGRKS